jgi:hypothetical protein
MTGRSTLLKRNLQLQFSSVFDPYAIDSTGRRTEKYLIRETGKLFRLTSAQITIGFSLQSPAGKKKETTAEAAGEVDANNYESEVPYDMYGDVGGAINRDYVDFDIPWSVNADFSWSYNKSGIKAQIDNSIRLSGDISLTPKWKIGVSSYYDFIAHEFTATNMSIYRDLHCWEMRFGIVPFGDYKSYSFTINAKSVLLRDLKWDKRKTWHDNF